MKDPYKTKQNKKNPHNVTRVKDAKWNRTEHKCIWSSRKKQKAPLNAAFLYIG